MATSSEWDEAVFRRSLADLVAHPPADIDAHVAVYQYWTESLDDAEASGAMTGVERDVLIADLQATLRGLPGVTVLEFSSLASLRLPFTKPEG